MLLVNAISLGGCAGIYTHSPALETASAKAADALPDEASALKPFDEQLANLTTFAAEEDHTVAAFWTGARDAHFARIIALHMGADRGRALTRLIEDRLFQLLGSQQFEMPLNQDVAIRDKANDEALAASQRREFQRVAPDDKSDLSCKALTLRFSDADALRLTMSSDRQQRTLGTIRQLCHQIEALGEQIKQADSAFDAAGGEIGLELKALREAEEQTRPDLSPFSTRLDAEIKKAEEFAKTGSSVAQLREFQKNIADILAGGTKATKFVGWDEAAEKLDGFLKDQVCGSQDVDDTTQKEAGCGTDDTSDKTQAIWGLAKALAQLSDANADNRRATQWLLAAKAIVAAERADANLELARAKAQANAHRQRLAVLRREAAYLALARRSATQPRPDCHSGEPGGDKQGNPHCLFATYVDSWNEGRIPASILLYRPIQIDRSFAVRRARIVAQKQHALMSAGANELKAYGAGGLKAEMIAQALFDAALLGVNIGEL